MVDESTISTAPGTLTELGLVLRLCRAAGVLDIDAFYALPPAKQALWLEYEYLDFTGSLLPRGRADKQPTGAFQHEAALAKIRAERGEAA